MGFFGREDGGKPAEGRDDQAAERAESLAQIEAGGIPLAAEQRLKSLGEEGALFASGLSVNEFALLADLGPRPLAPVLGASVYRVGWQFLPPLPPRAKLSYELLTESPYDEPSLAQRRDYRWNQRVICELDTITRAWNEVRRRALARLTEEALQVGADEIVGVHLERGEHDWARRTIDYLVSGTAVRLPGSTRSRLPVLTDLSAQDYWRLYSGGYEPAGFVSATAVVFASPSRSTRLARLGSVRQNQELDELSEALFLARDTVGDRLRSQAYGCRGVGMVGVELSHTVHREKLRVERSVQPIRGTGWQRGPYGVPYYGSRGGEVERAGWVITMHAAGTAIRLGERRAQFPPERVIGLGS